jgi:hypothetical protein
MNNRIIAESCKKASILIDTNNLNCRIKYNLNIILKSRKKVIIKGIVYNKKEKPSVGAAIEVMQVDRRSNVINILGYAYTDDKGEYLFCIEVLPYMLYEIAIYSPLNI